MLNLPYTSLMAALVLTTAIASPALAAAPVLVAQASLSEEQQGTIGTLEAYLKMLDEARDQKDNDGVAGAYASVKTELNNARERNIPFDQPVVHWNGATLSIAETAKRAKAIYDASHGSQQASDAANKAEEAAMIKNLKGDQARIFKQYGWPTGWQGNANGETFAKTLPKATYWEYDTGKNPTTVTRYVFNGSKLVATQVRKEFR